MAACVEQQQVAMAKNKYAIKVMSDEGERAQQQSKV